MKRLTSTLAIAGAVAAALALRVLPAYSVVFPGDGVNFQESDAWFHVRTVHNLLAHFPHRSGFDPYALYPGGQNIPTGPAWDYLMASVAWILGWGAPSSAFIDAVAAWLPAILGALFPIPAFFLARRFFGRTAGAFAALWMAVGSGGFLWLTHLGLADHHVAEGLLAFLTLTWMCAAVDGRGRLAWLAGIALGLFLCTRPAGLFVPAILACAAVSEPLAAAAVLRAVVVAAVVFLPAAGSQWSAYTWLALALTGALAAGTLVFHAIARRHSWSPATRRWAALAAVAAGVSVALLVRPGLCGSLWFEIRRVAGWTPASRMVATVQELQPVFRAGLRPGWPSVFASLGVVWIAALPALAWLMVRAFRQGRTGLRLLAIWSAVMAAGTLMQVRMVIYFLPVAAVLAGASCAWLARLGSPIQRRAVAAALVALVLAANLPWAIGQMGNDQGMDADWRQALTWLRQNSPQPFADPGAWSRYHPRDSRAAAQWGVAVWWEHGYAVEQLAHRIPMANGTQSGADDMARFFTETVPEAAVGWLRRAGARYVIVDPTTPMFAGANRSRFPVQLQMLGRSLNDFVQVLVQRTPHGARPLPVYLPTYYQTMAARLYLGDGEAVAGSGPWVFETERTRSRDGKPVELIVSSRHFASEADAGVYLEEHSSARLTVGCLDPGKSCVALPAVKGLKRVFSSDPLPVSTERTVRAVKIFQLMPRD